MCVLAHFSFCARRRCGVTFAAALPNGRDHRRPLRMLCLLLVCRVSGSQALSLSPETVCVRPGLADAQTPHLTLLVIRSQARAGSTAGICRELHAAGSLREVSLLLLHCRELLLYRESPPLSKGPTRRKRKTWVMRPASVPVCGVARTPLLCRTVAAELFRFKVSDCSVHWATHTGQTTERRRQL